MLDKEEVLDLIEIRSAIAAALPTVLSLLFAFYHFHQINLFASIIFLLIAMLMQLITNVWNNIHDYKNNNITWLKESINNSIKTGEAGLKRAYLLLGILLFITIFLSVILLLNANYRVLVLSLGLLGGLVALFYSAPAFSISDTPFGEIASGFTMGFVIFLAAVLINSPKDIIFSKILFDSFISSVIAIAAIANIMFANNISDRIEDQKNKRFTLVYYLGLEKSLILFKWIYIVGYLFVVVSVGFKALPLSALLTLVTAPNVFKNVQKFNLKQSKKETFPLSIKNAAIITITLSITIFIGILFNL